MSLIEVLRSQLGSFFSLILHAKDLAEFGELNICLGAAFLSIAELDGAIFEDITTETFEAFKLILELGRIV